LPGVPSEMKTMYETGLEPELPDGSRAPFARAALKIAGRSEPSVDRRIVDLYDRPHTDITILSGLSGIELQLRVAASGEVDAASGLAVLMEEIRARFGTDVYGRDDETLQGVVGSLMREAGKTLATAESCTGGLLGGAITSVPGSSGWYRGGFVVYSNELKVQLAGVSPDTLHTHGAVSEDLLVAHGAVSEPVARAMAEGVRTRYASAWGIGVTGIAGPGGGTDEKPVGTVHLAIAGEGVTEHHEKLFFGDRDRVRRLTAQLVLDRLRLQLQTGG
jgi:nicotinamide-nucleotide amidase